MKRKKIEKLDFSQFDNKFMNGNINKTNLLLRDGNARLMTMIKSFIKSEKQKSFKQGYEKGIKENASKAMVLAMKRLDGEK